MIRVTRETAHSDIARAYRIFIDGVCRGELMGKETKEFPVEQGTHSVQAKIDWCKSNTLNIEDDGSVVDIEVGSSLGGKAWIPFAGIVYTIFKANEYLWIKESGE